MNAAAKRSTKKNIFAIICTVACVALCVAAYSGFALAFANSATNTDDTDPNDNTTSATPEEATELEVTDLAAPAEPEPAPEPESAPEPEQITPESDTQIDYAYAADYGYDSGYVTTSSGDRRVIYDWTAGSDFRRDGTYIDGNNGFTYTYYSEHVLPGGGLDIPGRHVGDEGYIYDGDGNVCLASDDFAKGTTIDIPFGSGTGVVYDTGSGAGNLDVYTSW